MKLAIVEVTYTLHRFPDFKVKDDKCVLFTIDITNAFQQFKMTKKTDINL